MDLWIRSQDRTKIIKAPSIEIERVYKEETRKDAFYLCVDSSFWVGQYNTEERALEVLDEIQELILNSSKIWVESSCLSPVKQKDQKYIKELVKGDTPILDERLKIKTTNIDTVVYEMPLE